MYRYIDNRCCSAPIGGISKKLKMLSYENIIPDIIREHIRDLHGEVMAITGVLNLFTDADHFHYEHIPRPITSNSARQKRRMA